MLPPGTDARLPRGVRLRRQLTLPFPVRDVPCREVPEVFDMAAEKSGNNNNLVMRTAKGYCYSCPMLIRCQEFALSTNQSWGVWGGMSVRERRAEIRRRRSIKVTGSGLPDA